MHSVTAKLNNAAREFTNQNGVTFFVSLGEKNYDFKTKQTVWTNYDAALFAKDAQIDFYRSTLVEGSIIEVSGTGLIMEAQTDPQYKPKLIIQDAKLGFIHSQQGQQPQQQQAPQQQGGYQQQPPQQSGGFHQPPQSNFAPQQQVAGGAAPRYQEDNTPPF